MLKKFGLGICAEALILVGLGFGGYAVADIDGGSCTDAQKAQNTSEHVAQIGGKSIAYSATTGFIEVTAADKSSKACVFYTSYTVHTRSGDAPRPITFAFNGGPGSASLWLHLGVLGPKRVDMGSDGLTPPRTLGLIPNEYSPLDVTDVVMIDPVATGFSHAEDKSANDKFFGVKNDYASIAAFIRNYLDTFNRWTSPKFVMGESYGGIRGSLLAHHLQSDMDIGLAGVIFISPALSSTAFFGVPDNNVPYWTFLPTFATTAWYHKKIASAYQALDVGTVYAAAKQFAETRYRNALDQGTSLSQDEFEAVAQSVSDFTGLSKSKVEALNLKVADADIFGGLFESEKLVTGRYDSRFLGDRIPVQGSEFWQDPSGVIPAFPYTAAINDYLRGELGIHYQFPYNVLADIQSWPASSPEMWDSGFNVMEDLAQALSDNPRLQVMIASGFFDLACPMGTVAYEISQMPNGQKLGSRVHQKQYFGGHMMYINPAALQQLKSDMADFIRQQSN